MGFQRTLLIRSSELFLIAPRLNTEHPIWWEHSASSIPHHHAQGTAASFMPWTKCKLVQAHISVCLDPKPEWTSFRSLLGCMYMIYQKACILVRCSLHMLPGGWNPEHIESGVLFAMNLAATHREPTAASHINRDASQCKGNTAVWNASISLYTYYFLIYVNKYLQTHTHIYIYIHIYIYCMCVNVCMYIIYIYTQYVYIYMRVYMYIYMYMYMCMYMCMCMCMCMYACMYHSVCMYACMHVCMHVCMYVCMYACMHVCMYACM